jgi:23S rRNA pseudouridine2605 synthase
MQMRLQKALSQAGVASRRASEELIREGRVQVNGQVVTAMGMRVDPDRDIIVVDGRQIDAQESRRYVKLYKPAGVLSVLNDDRGRRALSDLRSDADGARPARTLLAGLHPVGRLDSNSEGLLLLTNDGALTERLTHPRYEHPKEYLVLVDGAPKAEALRALRTGVELEDGKTMPAQVERVSETAWGRAPRGRSWLQIVLHEGRKRQIRRMCAAVDHPVRRLIRVRIGSLELGDLAPGEVRPLTGVELRRLRAEAGLSTEPKFSQREGSEQGGSKRGDSTSASSPRGGSDRGDSRREGSKRQPPGRRPMGRRPPKGNRS